MTKTRRDEPNETTEWWRQVRHDQAERRRVRRERAATDILALQHHGYLVNRLTAYQYRIDGVLDLFPTSTRYHHLPTNRRGGYLKAIDCATRFLGRRERE